jgi:hypothetical protein
VKATILYTLSRVGTFAVLFLLLRLLTFTVPVAAIVAAVLAFVLSYLFFGRLRSGVAETIARRRAAPERDDDADEEDAALDGTRRAPRPARRQVPAEDD